MNKKSEPIEKALKFYNGSQAEFARAVNVTRAQVWQWLNKVNSIPAEKAIEIEEKTKGAVTCEELRPDVKWHVLRNKKATNAN